MRSHQDSNSTWHYSTVPAPLAQNPRYCEPNPQLSGEGSMALKGLPAATTDAPTRCIAAAGRAAVPRDSPRQQVPASYERRSCTPLHTRPVSLLGAAPESQSLLWCLGAFFDFTLEGGRLPLVPIGKTALRIGRGAEQSAPPRARLRRRLLLLPVPPPVLLLLPPPLPLLPTGAPRLLRVGCRVPRLANECRGTRRAPRARGSLLTLPPQARARGAAAARRCRRPPPRP
jgi:hypothetical protein